MTFTTKYTCVSDNMVYAIKCHACHKIYIGETGRHSGDRFREHLRSTRLPDSDLPIGRHFASPGHTTQDMLVSVISSGFRDATDRRSFGARMIFRHRTQNPGGLNVDFCIYLSVTLHAQFSVAFKPPIKEENPRNAWFIFQNSRVEI